MRATWKTPLSCPGYDCPLLNSVSQKNKPKSIIQYRLGLSMHHPGDYPFKFGQVNLDKSFRVLHGFIRDTRRRNALRPLGANLPDKRSLHRKFVRRLRQATPCHYSLLPRSNGQLIRCKVDTILVVKERLRLFQSDYNNDYEKFQALV